MVDYLFLGVMGVALSAAIYARLYGRRVKKLKPVDVRVGISPTSKALLRLTRTNHDYSPAISIALDRAKRALKGELVHGGSKEELKYLISTCEEALKSRGNANVFKEIGSLYSQLDLGGARSK